MTDRKSRRKAARKVPSSTAIECAWRECDEVFEPQRSTARYHSATCRQRAKRDRAAAAAAAKADEAAAAGDAEHSLVTAVRRELVDAQALDTVDGQIALQLARRVVEAGASGVSALARELRTTIAAAKAGAPTPAGPTPVPEAPPEPPSPLDEARRRREQKARQAADRT